MEAEEKSRLEKEWSESAEDTSHRDQELSESAEDTSHREQEKEGAEEKSHSDLEKEDWQWSEDQRRWQWHAWGWYKYGKAWPDSGGGSPCIPFSVSCRHGFVCCLPCTRRPQ